MSIAPQYINKQKIRRAFDRAANSYDDAAVLQKEVCSRLLEKLEYITLSPQMILDAGVGTGEAVAPEDVEADDLRSKVLELRKDFK